MVVRRAGPGDCEDVVTILTEAFADNELLAWVYVTTERSRQLAPAYFRWITRRTLEAGVVYLVEGKGALLSMPSSALDESPDRIETTRQYVRALGAERGEYLLAYEDSLRSHHPMHTPHWHGAYIAVRPAFQAQHVGHCLLHRFLGERGDKPIYVEATPPNAAWHEHAGGIPSVGSFQFGDFTLVQLWRNPSDRENTLRNSAQTGAYHGIRHD